MMRKVSSVCVSILTYISEAILETDVYLMTFVRETLLDEGYTSVSAFLPTQ